jgi:hypothetical protein
MNESVFVSCHLLPEAGFPFGFYLWDEAGTTNFHCPEECLHKTCCLALD